MNIVVALTKADAQAFQAALDARLGYPRAGVDVGGGIHMAPALTRTPSASPPIQHATLLTWGVLETPEVAAVAGSAVSLPVGAVVQTLDSAWFPVVVVVGASPVGQ